MGSYGATTLVGLAIGIGYNVFNVRSPAPPVVALIGLLAMLGGEQVAAHLRIAWEDQHGAIAIVRPPSTGATTCPSRGAAADQFHTAWIDAPNRRCLLFRRRRLAERSP